jgi:hypothetical protein
LLLILAARLLQNGDVTLSELRKVTRIPERKIVESLRMLAKNKFLDADYDYGDPPCFIGAFKG